MIDRLRLRSSLATSEPINPRRVLVRTLLGSLGVLGVLYAHSHIGHGQYGADFLRGIWTAGWHVLHGGPLYPPADPHRLFVLRNGFVTPPVIADIAAPFALLSPGLALGFWNALNVVALFATLWLLGIRRPGIYLLALTSASMLDSLDWGQPDAFYAFAAALAWRYRDAAGGPVALGWLIAAKLLAAPLLIWLILTRRFKAAFAAAGATVGFLLLSWATVGFAGMASYPKLLAADATAFEGWINSLSVTGGVINLGGSTHTARLVACLAAIAVALVIMNASRWSDEGVFAACISAGLLASPLMWMHYLVILLVPMAIADRGTLWMWTVSSIVTPLLILRIVPDMAALRWTMIACVVLIPLCAVGSARSSYARNAVESAVS